MGVPVDLSVVESGSLTYGRLSIWICNPHPNGSGFLGFF